MYGIIVIWEKKNDALVIYINIALKKIKKQKNKKKKKTKVVITNCGG